MIMTLTTALAYTLLLVDVASSDDPSYIYKFQMDLSTPLTGILDDCIGWFPGDSSTNFTWYGISFQLPEDAKITEGQWSNSPAQPLKEDGYVQRFNDTDLGVAEYNFTTSADRPVIRTRINDGMVWESFSFDFAGSDYAEQNSYEGVSCKISESGEGFNKTSTWRGVVRPTMTVSLERLSGPTPAPTPTPEPSSSSVTGSFFGMTALAFASSAFLLL